MLFVILLKIVEGVVEVEVSYNRLTKPPIAKAIFLKIIILHILPFNLKRKYNETERKFFIR